MKVKLSAEDRRWSLAVKERDVYTCRRCGSTNPPGTRSLHAHHIFTRARKSTRHDVDNGISVCFGCHMWSHRNPLEFHDWMKGELGPELYEDLQARSRILKRTGT